MKALYLTISLLSIIAVRTAYGAEYVRKGTIIQYEGVCFTEAGAETLLGDVATLKPLEGQIDVLREQTRIREEELGLCQTAVENLNDVVADGVKALDKSKTDCKLAVDSAKPTMLQEIGKVSVGIVIGILLTFL